MPCSACRSTIATGSSSAPRRQELLAAGYQPVGADFPVFLHPQTREEYALARTERKTAPGYRGFAFHADPDVTLEEDLQRRDLTINAMARGRRRRADRSLRRPARSRRPSVLRHVSPAFAEDPVRILRLARFAARFADFHVAPETEALMRADGRGRRGRCAGARARLAGGRARPDGSASPRACSRCCAAAARWRRAARGGPPVRRAAARRLPPGGRHRRAPDDGARHGRAAETPLAVRYACLGHDLGKGTTPPEILPRTCATKSAASRWCGAMSERLRGRQRLPRARRADGARARQRAPQRRVRRRGAGAPARALRCPAPARPLRRDAARLRMRCARPARPRGPAVSAAERLLSDALRRVVAVDATAVAAAAGARGASGPAIGQAIHDARVEALAISSRSPKRVRTEARSA